MVMRQVIQGVGPIAILLLIATGAVAWYRTGASEGGGSASSANLVAPVAGSCS
jgi:hypothetical protein